MSHITRASLLFVLLITWMDFACEATPQEKPKNQREAILQGINELEQLYQQQLDDRWEALELNDVTKTLLEKPGMSRRILVQRLGGVTAESSLRIKIVLSSSESRLKQYKRDKAEYPKRIAQYRATLAAGPDGKLFSLGMHVNLSLQGARERTKRARRRVEKAKKLKGDAAEFHIPFSIASSTLDKQLWPDHWRIKSARGQYNLEEHLHLKRMPKSGRVRASWTASFPG